MTKLPDITVWNHGNEYLKAAICLEENHILWVAALNASLSIELYLKSFLTKKVVPPPTDSGLIPTTSWQTKHGHNLEDLYNSIPNQYRDKILQESSKLKPQDYFLSQIKKHNGVFLYARYGYEASSLNVLGNDIIRFAEHFSAVTFATTKI